MQSLKYAAVTSIIGWRFWEPDWVSMTFRWSPSLIYPTAWTGPYFGTIHLSLWNDISSDMSINIWNDILNEFQMTLYDMIFEDILWHALTFHMSLYYTSGHNVSWRSCYMTCHLWYEIPWHGILNYDISAYGMTYDISWEAILWHDILWCDMVIHDMISLDMTSYGIVFYDITLFDIMFYGIPFDDITFYHILFYASTNLN